MGLSSNLGPRQSPEKFDAIINRALDLGVNHFDTAAVYGLGHNETEVGRVLKPHRNHVFLASKGGMMTDGVRKKDSSPTALRRNVEESLQRLNTDYIDLYYLHRWDKKVPIEDAVGVLGQLVTEGKIGGVGLSEVSATTLQKAHNETSITAVQNEYSLWTRNPELGVLNACEELGITLVAFSPVGRGFLAGGYKGPDLLTDGDIRLKIPRLLSPHYEKNQLLLEPFKILAKQANVTIAQLAIAWVLAQSKHIVTIPGTTNIQHLEENMQQTTINSQILLQAQEIFDNVSGARYDQELQDAVDTEEF